jgi:hypothetical protein
LGKVKQELLRTAVDATSDGKEIWNKSINKIVNGESVESDKELVEQW